MKKKFFLFLTLFISLLLTQTIFATYHVLFDNTKHETAANADWIIDDNQPIPSPSNPSSERSWQGALSSWAFELVQTGNFDVKTLTSNYGITYGDGSNPYDLSNFDVFIVCEPNNQFSNSEKEAIIKFVQNGGGLFVIADHTGSDRDHDHWDSPHAWNDLFENNNFGSNIFGVEFNLNQKSGTYTNVKSPENEDESEILNGSFGKVNKIAYHAGATIKIDTGANPNAHGLIWENNTDQSSTNKIVAAYSKYGSGRVVFVGDSSPADDGTGTPGDRLYDGWNEANDRIFFMNATLWLAKAEGGNNNDNGNDNNNTTDKFEPNDTHTQAFGPVESGKEYTPAKISTENDEDWFYFETKSPGNINIKVSIDDSNADLDWYLYKDGNFASYVKRGYTTNNPEEGTYNATESGKYFLKVVGYNGSISGYKLTVTFPENSNDDNGGNNDNNNQTDTNIALNMYTQASSTYSDYYLSSNAVDGDYYTGWASEYLPYSGTEQWIYVDFGIIKTVDSVKIFWSTINYATDYEILWHDGNDWQSATEINGDGGWDEIIFDEPITTRYIAIFCNERNANYYYIKEFEVYGH